MSTRLQQLLGPTSLWLLNPKRSAVICFGGWLLSLVLTWQHPWLALLGFIAVWGLTLALWLEAPLLQSLPLPPLTVLLIGLCLRWGVGPLFLSLGGSGGDPFVDIWIRYGPQAQLLWLSLTAALLFFALNQRKIIACAATKQPSSSWLNAVHESPKLHAQIKALAFILSLYMLSYILLSGVGGAFDRQDDSYAAWTQQLWRLDTPIAAFSRLRDIWFILFPLWWKVLDRSWRLFLGAQLFTFAGLAILSGSRGLLFYPTLLLVFGLWFVVIRFRLLRQLVVVVFALFLTLSPLVHVVRESNAFQSADSLSGRLSAVFISMSEPEPLLDKARWIGRDLYACHDPYLFTPENRHRQPDGFNGLHSLFYLWLPKHFLPNQPVIFDGHLIAKQLQYGSIPVWSVNWFPCFSLPADLMRRWSLSGVFLGSTVVAAFVQYLIWLWYRTARISGSTFQLLILLLPATYLQSFPFGTVSETAWALLWELPKYLVVLWILGAFVDRYLSRADL